MQRVHPTSTRNLQNQRSIKRNKLNVMLQSLHKKPSMDKIYESKNHTISTIKGFKFGLQATEKKKSYDIITFAFRA